MTVRLLTGEVTSIMRQILGWVWQDQRLDLHT